MDFSQLEKAVTDYQNRYADEQNITKTTRKNRKIFCGLLLRFFPGKQFDWQTCRLFIDSLRSTNSDASIYTYVGNLHAFIRFAVEYEYLETDFSKKIRRPKKVKRHPKFVNESEALQAITEGCKPSRYDNHLARKSKRECEQALKLALFAGLRNFELRQLHVEDFNFSDNTFEIQNAKGGDSQLCNIPANMIEPLREWAHEKKTGQMFAVAEETLRETYKRGLAKLGLRMQRVHDLRHVYSLTRLRRREPLQQVSRTLRHKKTSTTDEAYSEYLITDLAPTVNNSPEIQKNIDPRQKLDMFEQLLKDFGYSNDPTLKFVRTEKGLSIEVKGGGEDERIDKVIDQAV